MVINKSILISRLGFTIVQSDTTIFNGSTSDKYNNVFFFHS